jgi:glycosyltransferase involved in cell wall biosynthesis
MKIGLDLRMADGGAGISRYITELTTKLLALDKANQYVLFFNNLTDELKKRYEPFGHKMVETKISHYSVAEQLRLPGILNKEKLDLVHFPHFNVPIMYNKPFVVTIHDLTHTKFPGKKKSRIFHRLAYNAVLAAAVRKSKSIIAVSQSTKNEILEYFGVAKDKIAVVYEGANELYSMMDKQEAFEQVHNSFGISKPFILYVGVWRRYKNLPALAEAFDRCVEAGLNMELVLAGEPDPFYPEIKEAVYRIKNKDRIRELGRVSDEELKSLYNACNLFVLPSQHEGFGLTALEAAGCGAPIACSDISTLREVMGQAAEYFDPANIDNMTDVIRGVLSNPKRSEELANLALARTKHFSWKSAAEETIKVYESIGI